MRFLAAVLLCASLAAAQTTQDLLNFLHDLPNSPVDVRTQPQQLQSLLRPLQTASPDDVRTILTTIRPFTREGAAVNVQHAAVSVVLFISLTRDDGATLIADHLDVLEACLNFTRIQLDEGFIVMASYLRPAAPPEVVPMLLRLADRPDITDTRKANALGIALQLNQQSVRLRRPDALDQILPRITSYINERHSASSKTLLLDAIPQTRNRGPVSPRMIDILASALIHREPAVRARAVHNLAQLGPDEVHKQSAMIERLRTQDPSSEVRAEADLALRLTTSQQLQH